jgi:hypothetical protein
VVGFCLSLSFSSVTYTIGAMRTTETDITHLLPTDGEVMWSGVNKYLELAESGTLKAIKSLAYPEDNSNRFIILDGHHTSKAAHIAGLTVVRNEILETDDEVAEFVRTERDWWHPLDRNNYNRDLITTKKELRFKYENHWGKSLMNRWIMTVSDIPEVIHVSNMRAYDYDSVRVDRATYRI